MSKIVTVHCTAISAYKTLRKRLKPSCVECVSRNTHLSLHTSRLELLSSGIEVAVTTIGSLFNTTISLHFLSARSSYERSIQPKALTCRGEPVDSDKRQLSHKIRITYCGHLAMCNVNIGVL
jgi:hypothetical protein